MMDMMNKSYRMCLYYNYQSDYFWLLAFILTNCPTVRFSDG